MHNLILLRGQISQISQIGVWCVFHTAKQDDDHLTKVLSNWMMHNIDCIVQRFYHLQYNFRDISFRGHYFVDILYMSTIHFLIFLNF